MIDYRLVEALAVVIREGGFEKAARRLFITQSAVSQRIKQLEEVFGQVLLTRGTPPQPTVQGTRVLKLYNQVARLEDDLWRSLDEPTESGFSSIPIGVNADSLDTWFFSAVESFMSDYKVLLEIEVDDQEQTHNLMREGRVLCCISTRKTPMQGCRATPLGSVKYGLFCSPAFRQRWFANGVTEQAVKEAPMITYNRKDELNIKILEKALGKVVEGWRTHYVPSCTLFLEFIRKGLGYGAMPEQQAGTVLERGEIVELLPQQSEDVILYFHCWNMDSALLKILEKFLIDGFLCSN